MQIAEKLKSETNKSRRFAILAAKMAVSISLLAYLFTKLDFTSISKLNADITAYIVLSSLVMLTALWFMTLRWKLVLKLIEAKNYTLKLLYNYYLIGSFFNIFIPGAIGGDAMRLYYASKAYHITKAKSLLSVFIERVAGLFALGVILTFSLVFNDSVRERLGFDFTLIVLTSIGIVLALVTAKYFINKRIAITYKDMAVILFLSGFGQFGDILIAYIFSLYFGLEITLLNLMSIMPLVYLATIIPVSFGGVGVREGVMAAGMTLYGVDVSDAVIVSFLLYFIKIIIGIIGLFFYFKIGKKPNGGNIA